MTSVILVYIMLLKIEIVMWFKPIFSPYFFQSSTTESLSSLKSIAAQAVATAGLHSSISAPMDYSAESRGMCM